jgi:hypothetical protein
MQKIRTMGLLGIGQDTADLPPAAAASVADALIAAEAVARNAKPGKPSRPAAPSRRRDDETVRRIADAL